MATNPVDQYLSLMAVIRWRLDQVAAAKAQVGDNFARAEFAAFHGRKVVEGIAFGCLVAVKNGLKYIPRDAEGQWNAEKIFRSLRQKALDVLPEPAIYPGVHATLEADPAKRLTSDQVIQIYQRLHKWLHEVNPYVQFDRQKFYEDHQESLWSDLQSLDHMIAVHLTGIGGRAFACLLRSKTGAVEIMELVKT